jgi:hypothetical protein
VAVTVISLLFQLAAINVTCIVEAEKVSISQLHNTEVQFIVLMFTPLTNSSCLSAKALDKAVLSDGLPARFANETVFQWFIAKSHTLQS